MGNACNSKPQKGPKPSKPVTADLHELTKKMKNKLNSQPASDDMQIETLDQARQKDNQQAETNEEKNKERLAARKVRVAKKLQESPIDDTIYFKFGKSNAGGL